jgi:hypothetical protein
LAGFAYNPAIAEFSHWLKGQSCYEKRNDLPVNVGLGGAPVQYERREAQHGGVALMSAHGAQDRRFPGLTSIDFVPITELQQRAVRLGFDYWQRQCGTRKFPARTQIRPNEIATVLSQFSLIKVWEGGADYEVRIAGDSMNCAYRAPLNGRLISDIATDLPLMAARWRRIFDEIVATGLPLAVRTHAGHDLPETNFTDSEAVFLPLGDSDDVVDHLLLFAQHERRTR